MLLNKLSKISSNTSVFFQPIVSLWAPWTSVCWSSKLDASQYKETRWREVKKTVITVEMTRFLCLLSNLIFSCKDSFPKLLWTSIASSFLLLLQSEQIPPLNTAKIPKVRVGTPLLFQCLLIYPNLITPSDAICQTDFILTHQQH